MTTMIFMLLNLYAEFVWSHKDKPSTCASLNPVCKNQQKKIKYTFDVAKCDRIFYELFKLGESEHPILCHLLRT
jgi:hypothetical protein